MWVWLYFQPKENDTTNKLLAPYIDGTVKTIKTAFLFPTQLKVPYYRKEARQYSANELTGGKNETLRDEILSSLFFYVLFLFERFTTGV